jgi:hypothetical protein
VARSWRWQTRAGSAKRAVLVDGAVHGTGGVDGAACGVGVVDGAARGTRGASEGVEAACGAVRGASEGVEAAHGASREDRAKASKSRMAWLTVQGREPRVQGELDHTQGESRGRWVGRSQQGETYLRKKERDER